MLHKYKKMSAIIFRYKKKQSIYIDYQVLFEELRELCFPTFKYKQGNCHNIVHYCSLILNHRGIKHKKIWFYAPVRFVSGSKECIVMPDPNHLAISGNLKWGYHVALLFEDGRNCHVFDWMIQENKPMTINDWVMSMGLKNYKIDIVESENYLFYENPEKVKNNAIRYFKYEDKCRNHYWIAKGMAINETAYEFYQMEDHFRETYPKDFKLLVGSIINFECIIRDNRTNNRVNDSFREKHALIIQKYRNIYFKNLNNWIDKIEIYDI